MPRIAHSLCCSAFSYFRPSPPPLPGRRGICQIFCTSKIPHFFISPFYHVIIGKMKMGDVLLYLFWTNCQSLCNHLLKYIERIIICVNSWEFYPIPKIFYTLVTKSTSAPMPIFSFLSWQGPCQGPLEDCDFENFDVLPWGMQFSGDGALLKNTKNHIECAKIPKVARFNPQNRKR